MALEIADFYSSIAGQLLALDGVLFVLALTSHHQVSVMLLLQLSTQDFQPEHHLCS